MTNSNVKVINQTFRGGLLLRIFEKGRQTISADDVYVTSVPWSNAVTVVRAFQGWLVSFVFSAILPSVDSDSIFARSIAQSHSRAD